MTEPEVQEKNPIEIRCPRCFKDHTINISKEIKCPRCKKSFTGIRFVRPIVSGLATLGTMAVIGGAGGIAVDGYFESNRYPISVEYLIVENCISAYNEPMRYRVRNNKRDICECALEETQKKVDFAQYEESKDLFLNEFEKQAHTLAKQMRVK